MSNVTRRGLLKGTALAVAGTAIQAPAVAAAVQPNPGPGEVGQARWLEGQPPPQAAGVTWGMPWAKGRFPGQDHTFAVTTADGTPVPAQTWVTGYWGDGSIKWTAHAVGPQANAPVYKVVPGEPTAPPVPVTVHTGPETVDVDTG